MSLILIRTSQILSIRESVNSYNPAFKKENDSWKELEEIFGLFFVAWIRMPSNNNGELVKVYLSFVSGDLWHSVFVVDPVKSNKLMFVQYCSIL